MLLFTLIANMSNKECRLKLLKQPKLNLMNTEEIICLHDIASSVTGPQLDAYNHLQPQSISAISDHRNQRPSSASQTL